MWKRSKKRVLISTLFVLFLLNGCIHINLDIPEKECNTVGELAGREDPTIYLLENGEYTPYLVVSNQYQGGVLLLRENLLDEAMVYSDMELANANGSVSGYYPECLIDRYLNETFLNRFSDTMKAQIRVTSIEVLCHQAVQNGDGFGQTERIERQIFALSATEVIESGSGMHGREGEFLDYFEKHPDLTAYRSDKIAEAYWLRSAYLWTDIQAWMIGMDGKVGGALTVEKASVRPAFTLDSALAIVRSEEVEPQESVYVLDLDE